jgi:uncharacterized protein YbaR (Trm112 family)
MLEAWKLKKLLSLLGLVLSILTLLVLTTGAQRDEEREKVVCPNCDGSGQVYDPDAPGDHIVKCPKCKGEGWLYKDELDDN